MMRRISRSLVWYVAAAAAIGAVVYAQQQTAPARAGREPQHQDDVRQQLDALRQDHAKLQKQVDQILAFFRAQGVPIGPPENLVIALDGAQMTGRADAPVTVIEFSDFQCPFCGRYSRDTWPKVRATYVTSGKVRYGFRDFPIESSHPDAFKAHEAANCAAEQEKFWELHERMFQAPIALKPADLQRHAAAAGLAAGPFEACLASGKYAPKIRKDLADGQAAGVNGTPMFFVGRTTPDRKLKVEAVLRGAQPFERFQEAIDALLAQP